MIINKSTENTYSSTLKKYTFNIYFLLGSAFILRMLILFFFGNPLNETNWISWIWDRDTDSFMQYANDLYSGTLIHYPFRLPFYPFIIIATRNIFSIEWMGTILFHQLISIYISWLIYKLTKPYAKSAALIAAAIFVFEPASLIYSYHLVPEIIMVLIQLGSTMLIIKAASSEKLQKTSLVVLSSLILCCGVFFKPILLYSFLLYIIFMFIYFKDTLLKKVIYTILFIAVFQIPVHFYRQFIFQHFGVYSLTSQEFSEKAGRAIDIKYIAEHGEIMNIDSLRAEIRHTLISGGYDYNNPDNVLFAHITDSISHANIKKYPFTVFSHSFIDSYMFFQPSTKTIGEFLNVPRLEKLSGNASFKGKITHLEKLILSTPYLLVIIFSFLYSLMLVAPFLIAMLNKKLRVMYSPLIYFAVSWFLYTSVAVGRIAQTRYRVTFIWTFAILAGLVYSYIKENGIKSIIPSFLKRDKLPEK